MNAALIRTVTWRGVEVSRFRDGSRRLSFPEGQFNVYTAGDDDGRDLTQSQTTSEMLEVRPDAWRVIQVLPRARSLYDHSQFRNDAPARRTCLKNLYEILTVWPHDSVATDAAWDDGEDEERRAADPTYRLRPQPKILGAYIGYSMYMKGPVLMRSLRSGPSSDEARMNVSLFNFKGNEFMLEPGG